MVNGKLVSWYAVGVADDERKRRSHIHTHTNTTTHNAAPIQKGVGY